MLAAAAAAAASSRLLLLRRAAISPAAAVAVTTARATPSSYPLLRRQRRGLASQPIQTPTPPTHPPPHPYPSQLLKPEQAHHPHFNAWRPASAYDEEEHEEGFDFDHKMSVLMEVDDRPGALHEVGGWLRVWMCVFWAERGGAEAAGVVRLCRLLVISNIWKAFCLFSCPRLPID
jgi:hypothetical protein